MTTGPDGQVEAWGDNFFYLPFGRPYTDYATIALFIAGIALLGQSMSRSRPWLTGTIAVPLGYAFWMMVTVGLGSLVQALHLDPDRWGWAVTLSASFPEGELAFGIVLAFAMFVAAAMTVVTVKLGQRISARRVQRG